MLNVSAPYPHAGCTAFMDDTVDGKAVVRKVRIISHKPQDQVLIAIRGDRAYPREIASGNRTVPLSALREHEQAPPVAPAHKITPSQPSGRTRGRRR